MEVSFDVVDRVGHQFTAVVQVRQVAGEIAWTALLWDSGYVTDSFNGTSASLQSIEGDVTAVASEHEFLERTPRG